jgi:hypothetical protein
MQAIVGQGCRAGKLLREFFDEGKKGFKRSMLSKKSASECK